MILRRIKVSGFRCFRNPVHLDGLGVGAHLLCGPNETGKSSLMLAVARALFDRYAARGEEMEAVRPWGTSLSPQIELELETGGKRLLLEKSFLDGAKSLLHEWSGSRFERVAEAQEADERIRTALTASVSARKVSDASHWGLARLLWMAQAPGRNDPPGLDEPLKQRLLRTMGAYALDAREQGLLGRIEEAWLAYFTPKGQPKKNSPRAEAEARVAEAEAKAAELSERCAEAARLGEGVGELEGKLAGLASERKEHQKALESLEAEGTREAEIARALEEKRREAEGLRGRHDGLVARAKERAELEQRIAAHRRRAEELTPAVEVQRQELASCEEQQKARLQALDEARLGAEEAERELDRARSLERARALVDERRRLAAAVERAERLDAAIVEKRRERDARPSPSDEDVRKAEAAAERVGKLEAQLEVLGVEIAFVPEGQARTVAWEVAGERTEARPGPGDRQVFHGVDRGTLVIEGVGRIEVRSGAQEAVRLRGEVETARAELARLLGRHGVRTAVELRKRRDEGMALAREIATLESSLRELLSDGDLRAARQRLELRAGEIAAVAAQLALEPGLLEQAAVPDVAALTERLTTTRSRLKALEVEGVTLEKRRRELDLKASQLTRERDDAQRSAEVLARESEAKRLAEGTREQLEAQAKEIAGELALAQSAAKALEERLPPPAQRAGARRKRTEEALERVRGEERQVAESLARSRALLDRAGAEGLYTKLCEAEEALVAARRLLDRESRKEGALALLKERAEARRESFGRSLVGPIEAEVKMRLDYLRGPGRTTGISLSPELDRLDLQVSGGARVALSSVSWGTQEQAMLALRLSLGDLLARQGGEPQLLVLDDPLVNADPARHERALELLASAAESLQLLILTAFPERYRRLGAVEHDLQALSQASSIAA